MEINVYTNRCVSPKLKAPVTLLVDRLVSQLDLDVQFINVIFVRDSEIKHLHKTYLQQNTVTDVMTFNLSERGAVEGEIYIGAQRAVDQARAYNVSANREICRLVIHGCLHLAGYTDEDVINRKKMKRKEDELVNLYCNILASRTI